MPENKHRPEDGANYVLLLEKLRQGLDTLPGERKLLTLAVPAGVNQARHYDIPRVNEIVDYVSLMTYDYRDASWSNVTGHQTPLKSNHKDPQRSTGDGAGAGADVQSSVDYYLRQGMAPGKINVGAAFYGRGFSNVKARKRILFSTYKTRGLFRPFSGAPRGTWDEGNTTTTTTTGTGGDGGSGSGIFDYSDIAKRIATKEYREYYDREAEAAYAYSEQEHVFISYDSSRSVKAKCDLVISKNLGGIMAWDLSGDAHNQLTSVIAHTLGIVQAKK